ncbi:hypothetical protein CP533_2771 [Ophiocordyceps camponoti-saundersi (nom. inval.)]|nr:hypothetical protein CP533_2771 [Ophiocordyceps camponoti-saundersi (nom. inval.)]
MRWPLSLKFGSNRRGEGGLRGEAVAMVQDGEAFDAMASPCFLVFLFFCFSSFPFSRCPIPGLQFSFLQEDPLHDIPAYQEMLVSDGGETVVLSITAPVEAKRDQKGRGMGGAVVATRKTRPRRANQQKKNVDNGKKCGLEGIYVKSESGGRRR